MPTDGGQAVSLTLRQAALNSQEDSWYTFLLEARPRAIVRLEGLGQLKNALTSSGIQPAILRLVAQCFKLLFNTTDPLYEQCFLFNIL
jgi:hypothetical protein